MTGLKPDGDLRFQCWRGNMRPEVVRQLVRLNRDLYETRAMPFARTRARPQPGFERLATELPRPCSELLDVGCGEGRLGRFLLARKAIERYVGVDFSPALIAIAQESTPGLYFQADFSQPDCLDGIDQFAAIACLATLQHVPGRANRLRLLRSMATHLVPTGRIILSNWQFLTSERQRRKIASWSAAGLAAQDLEAGDYLLYWRGGGNALRYVASIDQSEIEALANAAGLVIEAHFRSDGREGDLNLYTVCALPV